jgi:hypothetical protein
MAKIRGPLFSYKASGSFGPRLTYQERGSGPQVRFQKAQADVTTTERTTERGYFIEAYEHWNTLSDADKATWDTFNKS